MKKQMFNFVDDIFFLYENCCILIQFWIKKITLGGGGAVSEPMMI